MTEKDDLLFLTNPQSIAIIGASENIDKIGGRPLYYMRKYNYQGRIYPINPARKQIQGGECWESLFDLPETPDLVIIAVAGDHAVTAVEQSAQLGVKGAIIISAGFAETGKEGKERQDYLVKIAKNAGMRLVGPNSQGLTNFGVGAIASFSTMFLEIPPLDGPVAVISQSGGMSAMVYGLLRQRDIGVRHMHATGNEADITVAELTRVVLEDQTVKVICLYLESIQNTATLIDAAKLAQQKNIPLIAVKSGYSQAGMQAALSHTGALANEDRLVDAFFEKYNIIRAEDPQEMTRFAELIVNNSCPKGKNVVVISNSGASCVLSCDAAEKNGLIISSLKKETQQGLSKVLSSFATTNNPIDVTAALLSNNNLFGDVLSIIGDDPTADAFILNIPVAGQGYDIDTFAKDASEFTAKFKKPVVLIAWQKTVTDIFRKYGITAYENESQAMKAIATLAQFSIRNSTPLIDIDDCAESGLAPIKGRGVLSEKDSLHILANAGIPIIEHYLVKNKKQALDAWHKLETAVVIKACSNELPHKSDHDLVELNLNDGNSISEAIDKQSRILLEINVEHDGWIIAKLEKDALHEAIVGAYVDDVFGPIVVIGSGGKYIEALPDVAVLLPPFTVENVLNKLRKLRLGVLLEGVRGEPAADKLAFAQLAVQVGQFIFKKQKQIRAIDINPVLIKKEGEGVVAVDALVELIEK